MQRARPALFGAPCIPQPCMAQARREPDDCRCRCAGVEPEGVERGRVFAPTRVAAAQPSLLLVWHQGGPGLLQPAPAAAPALRRPVAGKKNGAATRPLPPTQQHCVDRCVLCFELPPCCVLSLLPVLAAVGQLPSRIPPPGERRAPRVFDELEPQSRTVAISVKVCLTTIWVTDPAAPRFDNGAGLPAAPFACTCGGSNTCHAPCHGTAALPAYCRALRSLAPFGGARHTPRERRCCAPGTLFGVPLTHCPFVICCRRRRRRRLRCCSAARQRSPQPQPTPFGCSPPFESVVTLPA